ncbi:MAG: DUF3320 domain-containing protein [Solobacterium sp.]|nr:DUF3320 domain-containing protein [Solobacterium sp.]
MKVKWIDMGAPKFSVKAKEYKVTDLPYTKVEASAFVRDENEKEIRKRIEKVIETEAPISEWLLIKRVINSFGIMKAGIHVRNKMFKILDNMELKTSDDYDKQIYWRNDQREARYKTYRIAKQEEAIRDITQVPTCEIASAVYAICQEKNESYSYDELARLTAQLLGYTRMGSNVKLAMKRGIAYAVSEYPLQKNGSNYSLK